MCEGTLEMVLADLRKAFIIRVRDGLKMRPTLKKTMTFFVSLQTLE